MQSPPLEKEVRQHIRDETRRLGGVAKLLVENGRRGFPDLTLIFHWLQQDIFVETKRFANGKLTRQQAATINELRHHNREVHVVKGMDEAYAFTEALERRYRDAMEPGHEDLY